jgi:hypothetical protein
MAAFVIVNGDKADMAKKRNNNERRVAERCILF